MIIKNANTNDIFPLRQLWKQAFGDSDAYLDAFFRTAFSPSRCRCLFLGGRIAAAHYWLTGSFSGGKVAYIYAVATQEAYRKQGLCKKLMENTHRYLEKRGYAGAVLVPATEQLRAYYKKLGYRDFGGMQERACVAAEEMPEVWEITPEEYGKRRVELLPENGVMQGWETLAFLATQGKFYAGDGFICTAVRDGDHIFIPELLGTCTNPEGLVGALQAITGTVRTPGETPFAMYLPLTEKEETPTYFGLALD